MSDILDDLRAAQKTTSDSNTALLLGRATDEIEEMRRTYYAMLENSQHQLLRLGNDIHNYLAHNHDKAELEKLLRRDPSCLIGPPSATNQHRQPPRRKWNNRDQTLTHQASVRL
jgi:hypothetical protein